MTHYKAMNKNMQCKGFQFEVGKTYEMKGEPVMCERGFHCCAVLDNCLNYYSAFSRFFTVEMLGTVVTEGDKSVTNKIKIVDELSHNEINKESKMVRWEGDDVCKIIEDCVCWYKNGKIHRDNDLPAIVKSSGYREWWIEGSQHRDNDLPAIVHPNGDEEWWFNNERHRDNDLPAIVRVCGTLMWFRHGTLHRNNDYPVVMFTGR
jgi:hypothetical protein